MQKRIQELQVFSIKPFLSISLISFFCFFSASGTFAQKSGIEPDSCALIEFFNLLDQESQNTLRDRDWTTATPVLEWGGINASTMAQDAAGNIIFWNISEMSLSNLNLAFENLEEASSFVWNLPRLRKLNISNNRFRVLPNLPDWSGFIDLNCDNNQLIRLPAITNTTRFERLSCSGNLLESIPIFDFDANLRPRITIRNNNLGFDFLENYLAAFNSRPNAIITYNPQKPLGFTESYFSLGDTIPLEPNHAEDQDIQYQWLHNGIPIPNSNNRRLILYNITEQDAGIYTYQLIHDFIPFLTLEGTHILNLNEEEEDDDDDEIDLGQFPFDSTHLILEFISVEDAEEEEKRLEELGHKKLKEFCIDGQKLLQLWKVNGLIDITTLRRGRQSTVRSDTTRAEVNFFIDLGIIDGYRGDYICNINPVVGTAEYSVRAAFIDTGIFMKNENSPIGHSDFGENLAAKNYNRNEIKDLEDNDTNCIIDDVIAEIDFYNSSIDTTVTIAIDENGHGTHVMGIGHSNYPSNISLKVLDLKVYGKSGGLLFDLICAIHYAIEQEADVINISLGYYADVPSAILYNALKRAQEAGIIVVASAGNGKEGRGVNIDETDNRYFPAAFANYTSSDESFVPLDNIISVAALDATETRLASYSNFGSSVLIAARGTGIHSTYVYDSQQEGYATLSGTSMAAPSVTRLISIIRAQRPNLNYTDIINCIRTSGDTFTDKIEWGVKINEKATFECLGIETISKDIANPIHTGFRVYPNPFNEYIVTELIEPEATDEVKVQIYNTNGKLVYSHECLTNSISWDGFSSSGRELNNGIYYIRVQAGDITYPAKAIIKY